MRNLYLLLAGLAVPAVAMAQADSAAADSTTYPSADSTPAPSAAPQRPATLLTYTFTNPGEFVRVNLQAGVTYVAALDATGMGLTLKPRKSGVQKPDIRKDMMGASASGGTAFLVKPFVDAEYEIKCTGGRAGVPVTLTLSTR